MNRNQVKVLRDVIQKALNDTSIEADLNVKLNIGNASYSDATATFKLEVSSVNADGTVNTKMAEDFKFYAFRYDLSPEDLGKIIRGSSGNDLRIIGCKPRSTKYPIILEDIKTGSKYKYPADLVRIRLAS